MGEAGGSWASGRVPDVPPCHQVGEVLPREGASAPSPHRNGANRPHSDKRDGFSRCQFQQAFLPPSLCYFLFFFFFLFLFFLIALARAAPHPPLLSHSPVFLFCLIPITDRAFPPSPAGSGDTEAHLEVAGVTPTPLLGLRAP